MCPKMSLGGNHTGSWSHIRILNYLEVTGQPANGFEQQTDMMRTFPFPPHTQHLPQDRRWRVEYLQPGPLLTPQGERGWEHRLPVQPLSIVPSCVTQAICFCSSEPSVSLYVK
jgi:hypothetical protein